MEELKKQIEDKIKELTPKMHEHARWRRKRKTELYQERILTYKQVLKLIEEITRPTSLFHKHRKHRNF
jgi:NAD dependent epimerase/dehydratase family enzyme